MSEPMTAAPSTSIARAGADPGSTFIELLVSIVLLGTVVVATLTALRASIVSSEFDQNSARAYAWLQGASDELQRTSYLACDANLLGDIEVAYQSAAAGAIRPNEWGSATMSVAVLLHSRSGNSDQWGTTCASGDPESPIDLQLVTISVTAPDGSYSAGVEVIKRD